MRRLLILFILLIVAVCGYFYYQNYDQQDHENREVFDVVMAEKMQGLYVQARNWSKPIKFDVHDERLSGDYKIMSEFILNFWIQNIEARNTYIRELDRLKWRDFLSTERFEHDRKRNYVQTKTMLIGVKNASEEFKRKHESISKDSLVNVDALNVKSSLKKAMKTKLELTQNDNDQLAMLNIELQILDKAEAMFAMLQKYKWAKRGKTFLFAKDEQVAEFNILYSEILEYQAQIDQLKKQNANVFKEMK